MLLILGSVAVILVVAVTLVPYFLLGKAEKESNRERTEPARAAKAAKAIKLNESEIKVEPKEGEQNEV